MTATSDPSSFDVPGAATAAGPRLSHRPPGMTDPGMTDQCATDPGVAAPAPRFATRVEWRTVALAGVIYGGWILAVLAGGAGLLPVWVWAPAAAWFVAWQASLQHEVIHGHPTPSAALNRWIAGPPLALWLCYARYRTTHLQHHVDDRLTDPLDDPESFYVTAAAWDRAGPLRRGVLHVLHTLAGRLVLGPLWTVCRVAATEARAMRHGDAGRLRIWLEHGALAAVLLIVLQMVFAVPAWLYLVAVVWPATSLMLLRSFAEHRPAADPAHRSAIVDSHGPLALLFLANNLHALHHERPGLPWFVLPKIYRANRDAVLARNGGYRLNGYAEVALRWLFAPRDHPRHPGRTA